MAAEERAMRLAAEQAGLAAEQARLAAEQRAEQSAAQAKQWKANRTYALPPYLVGAISPFALHLGSIGQFA
ncbi:MAG: hypothetical protein F6J93_15375 [Oscillatoria sp. SIO1A7]|nr:hypothetical protein [Oscillatoria sp. SIO1A7]